MTTVEERFWPKVKKTPTCWLWTACTSNGYGMLYADGRTQGAHRISYALHNGPIPAGLVIDHICQNPSCVNPDHLRTAAHKQNMEHVRPSNANTSGYRGVSKHRDRWSAYVVHNGRQQHVGIYKTPEDAAEAARLKRLELFTHNDLDRAS
jgi:hypothetical protein